MNNMPLKRKYRENESRNMHAENYVLLAEWGGNKVQKYLANMNLKRLYRLGHTDSKLSALTHSEINPLFYKLFN